MKQYIFILGSNPALSVAEVFFVFEGLRARFEVDLVNRGVLVVSTKQALDAAYLQERLGGTIKIGEGLGMIDSLDCETLFPLIQECARGEGKMHFGLSYFSSGDNDRLELDDLRRLGLDLKKQLKASGRSVRWVESKELVLSSVVTQTNKLLRENGVELLLLGNKGQYIVGKVLTVQPFDDYSKRDYGRPSRDDKSGMLPPKLAKMMINLGGLKQGSFLDAAAGDTDLFAAELGITLKQSSLHKSVSPASAHSASDSEGGESGEDRVGSVLDPFCGSGTVLQEAVLMGHIGLGSDRSEKAVEDSKENLKWLTKSYNLSPNTYSLKMCDARDLSGSWKEDRVDVIVTEPYLGPQDVKGLSDLDRVIEELVGLYVEAFKEFKKVLSKGGRVVFIAPIFIQGKKKRFLSDDLLSKVESEGFELLHLKEYLDQYCDSNFREITAKGTILYSREGQRVGRDIMVFERV